jgi:predicted DNA-binding protein (MmcQ/YjbR family)
LSFGEDGTTGIEEYFPFGDRAFRVVGGKIFLYASEYNEGLYLNVRLPMGIREHALSMPNVEVPKYIGHHGWVGVRVKTPEELNTAITWIDISYDENLVKKKSKKK